MLRKTLSALSAAAVFGTLLTTANPALAFPLPPPPMGGLGGLPPIAHVGPPPMAHLGGLPHAGGVPQFRPGGPVGHAAGSPRFGGRVAGYGHGRSAGYGYSRSGWSRYGHGYGRRWGGYGAYGYGTGSSSDYGCYYAYNSNGRRVAVCDDN